MSGSRQTKIGKIAFSDKWVEFWSEGNDTEKWDMSSKAYLLERAIDAAGLRNHVINNGYKGLVINWERIGPNFEIQSVAV